MREEGFTAIGQRRSKYRLEAWFAEDSPQVLLPLARFESPVPCDQLRSRTIRE